jgi:hypothetical protein
MSLKTGFLKEPLFPAQERGSCTIEDCIIPLLPNWPDSKDEAFHEEGMGPQAFGLFHHAIEA